MKKQIKAPTHQSLIKPYLKDKKLKEKIESGVQRLKGISQIVELREKLHLTQTELAKRIGVSQPFIARIENDEASNLSLETLFRIVDALHGEIDIRIRPAKKAA